MSWLQSLFLIFSIWQLCIAAEYKKFGLIAICCPTPKAELFINEKRYHPIESEEKWKIIEEEGCYRIDIRRTGYSDFSTNIEISAGSRTLLNVTLTLLPYTLFCSSRFKVFDIYINSEKTAGTENGTAAVSNIILEKLDLYIYCSNYFFYDVINKNKSGDLYYRNIRLKNQTLRPLGIAVLALVLPGANYFVHTPRAGLPYIIPPFVFYYTSLGLAIAARKIQIRGLINESISNPGGKIMIFTGIFAAIHSFFCYFGVKQDLDELHIEMTGEKEVPGVKAGFRKIF